MRILPSLAQLLGQALILAAVAHVKYGPNISQTILQVFMFLVEPMSISI